jgi:hypothetical protein
MLDLIFGLRLWLRAAVLLGDASGATRLLAFDHFEVGRLTGLILAILANRVRMCFVGQRIRHEEGVVLRVVVRLGNKRRARLVLDLFVELDGSLYGVRRDVAGAALRAIVLRPGGLLLRGRERAPAFGRGVDGSAAAGARRHDDGRGGRRGLGAFRRRHGRSDGWHRCRCCCRCLRLRRCCRSARHCRRRRCCRRYRRLLIRLIRIWILSSLQRLQQSFGCCW